MKRCAIYTRKSTDEGLEQDFNSLDAQFEACGAYVQSQKHEGWRGMRERFDDGGYSGGNMERPGLRKLLELVRERRIDIIVVYKVDRLTRSLADFAKMVELFDAYGVSFVSVTQQFNTTTSMGRLTLNVLLSFAQFEREVTAERIRDKIAASKQKGMWMGGAVPLGYDAINKKLVVNKDEAKIVQSIFNLYIKLGTVQLLKDEVDRQGYRTKIRQSTHARMRGGRPLSRGHLYTLLNNPIYVGKTRHKGKVFDGQHEPIVSDEVWDRVQEKLASQRSQRKSRSNAASPSLLKGLLYDEKGERLSPSHSSKNGKRYRYYISHQLLQKKDNSQDSWRLPAHELEKLVCDALASFIGNKSKLASAISNEAMLRIAEPDVKEGISKTIRTLLEGAFEQQHKLLTQVIERVAISTSTISIQLNSTKLELLLFDTNMTNPTSSDYQLHVPIKLQRRGVERKITLLDPLARTCNASNKNPDPTLCRTVAKAHCWMQMLITGEANTVREIAQTEGIAENEISRRIQLAFLAPDIVEAIIQGQQPNTLAAQSLIRLNQLPSDWAEQKALLGFE
jgi:site-specific DNA recombinase